METSCIKNEELLNSLYYSEQFLENFNNCWRRNQKACDSEIFDGLKIDNKPFNYAFLPNIIQDVNFLNNVSNELNTLKFIKKNNDLYKFQGTKNLCNINKPNIEKLCNYIKGPVKEWVHKLTGLALNEKVALSCSRYDYSDTLLCHDDELEGRRIAFVFYLVPEWGTKDGGSLDLFSVDENNRPLKIVERICPKFNSFSIFEVSPVSFHQVSEVLSTTKSRLSVNGWFHGEPIIYPPRPIPKAETYQPSCQIEEKDLYAWISPLYLDEKLQHEVRQQFRAKSEVQLSEFLTNKKFKLVCNALEEASLNWSYVGPPYKKHYEIIIQSDLSGVLTEYVNVMQSEAMCLVLSQLTGLDLHALVPQDDDDENDPDANTDSDDTSNQNSSDECDEDGALDNCDDALNVVDTNSRDENAEVSTSSAQKRKYEKAKSSGEKRHKGEHLGGRSEKEAAGGLLRVGWQCEDGEGSADPRHSHNEERQATCRTEIRRWRWGAYSLMRDDDLRKGGADFSLDASLFCAPHDWHARCGGAVIYIAKDEEEELLTITPKPNSLVLVYHDKGTLRFTKHVNAKSTQLSQGMYNELYSEYKEIPQ